MKRLPVLVLICVLALALWSCGRRDAVADSTTVYEVSSEVCSLDVRINAADFRIECADCFSVESNLKNLEVTVTNGVLRIIDRAQSNSNYSGATLTLYVPDDTVFDEVDISTGAAKLTAEVLSARSVELSLGAGDVRFERLVASSEVDIEGGAGQITVADGELNDLSLKMGMGELNLSAALSGYSELEFGVGEANITVIGSRDEYKVDIEKGLGAITVDGKDASDFGSGGSGYNTIQIEGGIGAIHLNFKEA